MCVSAGHHKARKRRLKFLICNIVGADVPLDVVHADKRDSRSEAERFRLGDANQFGGTVSFLPNDFMHPEWENLEPVSPLSDNCRGIGTADLARCIREGGRPIASADMACHVLDVIEKIIGSGADGTVCVTETSCERPASFDHWRELMKAL